jgi:hypothetical protein
VIPVVPSELAKDCRIAKVFKRLCNSIEASRRDARDSPREFGWLISSRRRFSRRSGGVDESTPQMGDPKSSGPIVLRRLRPRQALWSTARDSHETTTEPRVFLVSSAPHCSPNVCSPRDPRESALAESSTLVPQLPGSGLLVEGGIRWIFLRVADDPPV